MDTPAPVRRVDVVAYLKLFRFPLVFTAIADSATGRLLVGGEFSTSWPTLLLLAVSSAGLYFFGMSLNDIADRARDKELAPGRMLPSGRLSLGAALTACFTALAISLIALLAIRETPLAQRFIVWLHVCFFICAYNLFLKIPPVMGLVRASNVLMGVFASLDLHSAGNSWHAVIGVAVPSFVYVTALTYVSTLEEGTPNRVKLGIGAAFMVVGAGLTSFVVSLADALRSFGRWHPVEIFESLDKPWAPLPFISILAGWIGWRAWKAEDKKGVMLLVRDGIGGIIFVDAALLAAYYPYAACAVAALIVPAIVSVALFKKLA